MPIFRWSIYSLPYVYIQELQTVKGGKSLCIANMAVSTSYVSVSILSYYLCDGAMLCHFRLPTWVPAALHFRNIDPHKVWLHRTACDCLWNWPRSATDCAGMCVRGDGYYALLMCRPETATSTSRVHHSIKRFCNLYPVIKKGERAAVVPWVHEFNPF